MYVLINTRAAIPVDLCKPVAYLRKKIERAPFRKKKQT